jgi:hypothetical protein
MSSTDEKSPPPAGHSAKKPYARPALTVYGGLALIRTATSGGNTADAKFPDDDKTA